MSVEPVNPYFSTELKSRIFLHPSDLNENIYYNILHTLKKNKVGKYCKFGFITRVIEEENIQDTCRIISKYSGISNPEDLGRPVARPVNKLLPSHDEVARPGRDEG